MQLSFADIIIHVVSDKFAFKAFNCLTYDRKISNPLMVSYLLRLPNHYILLNNVKSINLVIFRKCFSKFVLHIYKPRSTFNNFVKLWHRTSAPFIIFL